MHAHMSAHRVELNHQLMAACGSVAAHGHAQPTRTRHALTPARTTEARETAWQCRAVGRCKRGTQLCGLSVLKGGLQGGKEFDTALPGS
jgi:hypothetical protein